MRLTSGAMDCEKVRADAIDCHVAVLAQAVQARQRAFMANQSPPRIFDATRRRAIRQRSARLSKMDPDSSYILSDMTDDVIERVSFLRLEPARSLVIGDRHGRIAAALPATAGEIVTADPLTLDEEAPLQLGAFDFIASVGTLDTVNDLPGALIHLRNALAPGGVLIASMMGAGSAPLLRRAMLAADGQRPAARMHPMVDRRAGAELLQRSGFARQVVDSRSLDVRYSSLETLVRDMRAQGLSNALVSRPPALTRKALVIAKQEFLLDADENGRVSETFEILTLTGWKS